MKKILSLFLGFLLFVTVVSPSASASQAGTGEKPTMADRFKIVTEAEYDPVTKNLNLNISNVLLLKELRYRIKYTASKKNQTIYGEITPYTNNAIERNLRLGDCSGTACTYDGTIDNLEVEYVAEYYLLGSETISSRP